MKQNFVLYNTLKASCGFFNQQVKVLRTLTWRASPPSSITWVNERIPFKFLVSKSRVGRGDYSHFIVLTNWSNGTYKKEIGCEADNGTTRISSDTSETRRGSYW
uniref:Uncharacterized protein n=1 Tax=Wolfiporia cocos TaxID=81056 RepID=A0A7G7YDW0_9APHY|nr:hypothetical protein [Wolfiporia cocos]